MKSLQEIKNDIIRVIFSVASPPTDLSGPWTVLANKTLVDLNRELDELAITHWHPLDTNGQPLLQALIEKTEAEMEVSRTHHK